MEKQNVTLTRYGGINVQSSFGVQIATPECSRKLMRRWNMARGRNLAYLVKKISHPFTGYDPSKQTDEMTLGTPLFLDFCAYEALGDTTT